MARDLEGQLSGEGLRIGIVVAKFNDLITTRLLEGAKAGLRRVGVADDDVDVAWVPGAMEIPVIAKQMAAGPYAAVVCLGAVIGAALRISTTSPPAPPTASRGRRWIPGSRVSSAC